MDSIKVPDCLDSLESGSDCVLANFFLVAHPASLLRLLFRGCFRNRRNKVTLSKPYDMLLSRNLHVSPSFKDKGCNHFALKSQEWFLTTILLIHNKAVEQTAA